jgi:uncharacterized protein YbbK (DUF523 family)
MAKKVLISACILGEHCRYDGKTKKIDQVLDKFKDCKIIPFCPEAPLFGTPRERINVVMVDGEKKIITDQTNVDVTELLKDEINSFIQKNNSADTVVLKSKSPSCGYKTTPILDQDKNIISYDNGIAADMFLEKFPEDIIFDENHFLD